MLTVRLNLLMLFLASHGTVWSIWLLLAIGIILSSVLAILHENNLLFVSSSILLRRLVLLIIVELLLLLYIK